MLQHLDDVMAEICLRTENTPRLACIPHVGLPATMKLAEKERDVTGAMQVLCTHFIVPFAAIDVITH